MEEQKETFEDVVDLDYVKDYFENLTVGQMVNPWFCCMCVPIRGTTNNKKTFLNEYETLLYKSRDMCTKCFDYLNKHSGEEALENRIKIWEEATNLKIKRVN